MEEYATLQQQALVDEENLTELRNDAQQLYDKHREVTSFFQKPNGPFLYWEAMHSTMILNETQMKNYSHRQAVDRYQKETSMWQQTAQDLTTLHQNSIVQASANSLRSSPAPSRGRGRGSARSNP
jgi:hypothetical protein